MEKIVSIAEMMAIEHEADLKGLSYAQMMENAGCAVAEQIDIAYSQNTNRTVIALVGSGNNGGDALVAVAELANRGWHISAYLVRPRVDGDPLVQRVKQSRGRVLSAEDDSDYSNLQHLLETHQVLIDGVLGTGTRLPLQEEVASCLEFVCDYVSSHRKTLHIVAVDCPSGIDCDSGQAPGEVIPAELTITMAAIKRGLLAFPTADSVGALKVVSIGDLHDLNTWESVRCWLCDSEYVKQTIPLRPRDAHKGTFGTALVIAGSMNYTGAALLAGSAAYKVGAGLVQMAIPEVLHHCLAGQFPEAIWLLLPHSDGFISVEAANITVSNMPKATALLLGPGFGLQETTQEYIHRILTLRENPTKMPKMVVDADGLKLLSKVPDWYHLLPGPAVLTPHPGEMAILSGMSVDQIQADRISVAQKFAAFWGHVIVLKGAFTVIASPDGKAVIIPIATSALAKAGTGDVLAGIIVGLLAQGVLPFDAAVSGAWIHAMAGLKAESRLGTASVLASDLLPALAEAFKEVYMPEV